jgi:hypothetical protein
VLAAREHQSERDEQDDGETRLDGRPRHDTATRPLAASAIRTSALHSNGRLPTGGDFVVWIHTAKRRERRIRIDRARLPAGKKIGLK